MIIVVGQKICIYNSYSVTTDEGEEKCEDLDEDEDEDGSKSALVDQV